MVSARRLITEFDLKFDRFKSDYKKNIRNEHKLMMLNEAQDIVFEDRVKYAETNSLLRNDLRPFELKEVALTRKSSKEDYDVFAYPPNLYKMLRQKAIVSKPKCPNKKTLSIEINQTDDLNRGFNNPYWESSFEWEYLKGDEAGDELYVFHQSNLNIESVIIDYYRRPKTIHGASMFEDGRYTDWNGDEISFDQDMEFNTTYAFRRIVDIAILIARSNLGDLRDYKLKIEEILNKDRVTI